MIRIKNLGFFYKKRYPILKDLTSELNSGKIYGLLGLNGEGKTTFLHLIAGLLFPKSGTITIGNNNLSTNRSKSRRAQLYMLPDHPKESSLKIEEYVSIYSVFYENFSKEQFREALEDFHLQKNSKINDLSFGQQKKLYLSFALATNTDILLLDEPINGLDIPSKATFRKLLAKSINEQKIIIIATHLINDIENLIDHLLIIKDRKLVFDKDIFSIQEEYAFGGSPQITNDVLYAEKSIAQYKTIKNNVDKIDTPVDIELLFNAIQNEKL